ncbi:MAG: hypothetical protein ACUVUG_05380 [Candidatus Aminicenantia bacterium]
MNTRVKNLYTDLQSRTEAFAGGFSTKFGKNIFINARLNYRNMNSDSIFIDVVEPKDNAGLNQKETYAEAYPDFGSLDYLRKSVFTREYLIQFKCKI